jgi:serine/threonine protein kinase
MAQPNMIGHYRLTKTLGAGAFGKVKSKVSSFLTWPLVGINEITKAKVAVKILKKKRMNTH